MASRDPRTDRVIESVRCSFLDFVEKRRAAFPTVLQRMAADPFGAGHFLRPFAWLSLKHLMVRNRKFIFLSDKYPDMLESMSGDEVSIIGTASEFLCSRRLGIGYCFSGDLYLASHAMLFGAKGIPVERIVQRWFSFFNQQADPCYLILPQDTSPISLLLAKISVECPNMRSVCIQHGLFNAGSDADDIEGRNSTLNLVYDESQKDEMLRRLPAATVEVMGFPADMPVVDKERKILPAVILVGTGYTEQLSLLAKSLDIYREVASILGNSVSRVVYRQHPGERRHRLPDPQGLDISREPKRTLLSGPRKVFIGFNSTLLYEASIAGHLVIILDHEELPGYGIQQIGVRLHCSELAQLPLAISGYWHSDARRFDSSTGDLRGRVLNALQHAELKLSERHQSDPKRGYPDA